MALACKNLAPYGERVKLLPVGLVGREREARFSGKGTGGSIAEEGTENQTISVPSLLDQIPGGYVDILKIDIEGTELEVFQSEPEAWLRRVRLIIAELHGPEIEGTVLDILRQNKMTFVRYRSVWYCRHAA